MRAPVKQDSDSSGTGFDYSTPEARKAMRNVTALVLEVREDMKGPAMKRLERRLALYERSLGLAVIPVLLRRAAIALWRKTARRNPGTP